MIRIGIGGSNGARNLGATHSDIVVRACKESNDSETEQLIAIVVRQRWFENN